MSSSPPPNPIANTRVQQAVKANSATTERALANVGSTATAGVVGISAAVTVAASMAGVAGVIPPLAPAALAVIIACLFIIRQKGLNEELASNLYFIKMEVERMSRIHNVMKEISKEANINLNTASLAIIMDNLKDKILQFADNNTKNEMKAFENLLKTDIQQAQQLADNLASQAKVAVVEAAKNPKGKKLSFWLPKGWVSRWLSPSETLRQIIRDITIANVWFSIMLGEFHIFIQYHPSKTDSWKNSEAMKELLNANYMLGTTTSVNQSNNDEFNLFYNLKDTQEALGELTEEPKRPETPNPSGGKRNTRRYKKKRQSKYTRKN